MLRIHLSANENSSCSRISTTKRAPPMTVDQSKNAKQSQGGQAVIVHKTGEFLTLEYNIVLILYE